MPRPLTVEVKRRLDGIEERYPCEAALIEPGLRAVLIYVLDRAWRLPGLTLLAGMTTWAHFWSDRAFNVYHWIDRERTVAYYFNVGETAEISEARVAWSDYAVDVLVTPGGTARVLDEDELSGASLAVRELVAATTKKILADLPALIREVEAETSRLL